MAEASELPGLSGDPIPSGEREELASASDAELVRRFREGNDHALRMLLRRQREEAAEREVRAYRQFLRDVSHDIRSPLHSIIFLTEALLSNRGEDRPEAEQRQLGTIYAAGTSLLNLVNDLLDYARIQQGDTDEGTEYAFSLSSVVTDVRQLLAPLVQHRGTEVTVESGEDDRYVGDPHLLNRVLTNLVSNAVEAAGEEGHVAVRLERRDGGLLGRVRDDGDDADVEKLRALLGASGEGGSMVRVRRKLDGNVHGLGLMICSRLVRQANGWIEVQADGGGPEGGRAAGPGTCFTFWLPFPPGGEAQRPSTA